MLKKKKKEIGDWRLEIEEQVDLEEAINHKYRSKVKNSKIGPDFHREMDGGLHALNLQQYDHRGLTK